MAHGLCRTLAGSRRFHGPLWDDRRLDGPLPTLVPARAFAAADLGRANARCYGRNAWLASAKLKHDRAERPASADVAQLVEHHLAKVRVAGSNPVVRSELRRGRQQRRPPPVEWPRGEATACKAVYTGSNPVSTSRAISSVGERYLDTVEVTGSIPVSPTQAGSLGDSENVAAPCPSPCTGRPRASCPAGGEGRSPASTSWPNASDRDPGELQTERHNAALVCLARLTLRRHPGHAAYPPALPARPPRRRTAQVRVTPTQTPAAQGLPASMGSA